MSLRPLSPSTLAELRNVSRMSPAAQKKIAQQVAPNAFKAERDWTWGRKSFRMNLIEVDFASAYSIESHGAISAIEYEAIKGRNGRITAYRHEFESPLPHFLQARAESRVPLRHSGAPRLADPAVFRLGRLLAIETAQGMFRWDAPPGLFLVGCPHYEDIHIVRTNGARSIAPLFVMRARSKYRLTPRGIEG